jgi:hypothetical protein
MMRSVRLDSGAFSCGRAEILEVVDVMAAVMRLICAPTWAVAAVLSKMLDEGDSGARVASTIVLLVRVKSEREKGETD